MAKHQVCSVEELPEGERRIVTLEGKSIGLFNVKGEYYALKNACPHQQAPLCEGKIIGIMEPSRPNQYSYVREGEIVRCPWHGWEFDIINGKSIFDPHKCLVKTYDVEIMQTPTVETYQVEQEQGWIYVRI